MIYDFIESCSFAVLAWTSGEKAHDHYVITFGLFLDNVNLSFKLFSLHMRIWQFFLNVAANIASGL